MSNNTATAKVSARILASIAAGADPVDALKAVCGAENVDRMINELYVSLREGAAR